MAGIQYKPVGIFWDIENCSVPKNKLPSDVIAHIRNFFVFNRLNHREYEFLISCDVTRLRKDIPDDINKAGGVTLAHVSGNSKNAADEKLRENMKKLVDTHASTVSPVIIIISGDIDFVNDLRAYQTRLGCTIILIHATNCSIQMKIGWNEIYCFTDFCSSVRVNPSLEAAVNAKNIAKQTSLTEPKIQNQGVPPKSRNNDKDPHVAVNMAEKPQHSAQAHQVSKEKKWKTQIPQFSGVQQPDVQAQLPKEKKWKSENAYNNNVQEPLGLFPPSQQQRGEQPFQGKINKLPNQGPNANNVIEQHVQQIMENIRRNRESAGQVTAGVNNITKKDPQVKINKLPNQGPNANNVIEQHVQQIMENIRRNRESAGQVTAGVNNITKKDPQVKINKLPKQGPNTIEQHVQQITQNIRRNKESAGQVTAGVNSMTMKDPPEEIILMVRGLPGKLDFKILKENLQMQANRVHGKVKYVKNGQAFITFNNKANADRAVELFNGKEVFGKKLKVSFVKSIPFEGSTSKSNDDPEGLADW